MPTKFAEPIGTEPSPYEKEDKSIFCKLEEMKHFCVKNHLKKLLWFKSMINKFESK